jgi:hypothetical protein
MRQRLLLNLLLTILFSFTARSTAAAIRVVSDIDDTMKISNVGDPLSMAINGMFTSRPFTGMRELYQSFKWQRRYVFSYVTGLPDALRFRAEKFLNVGGFPKGELHLKPLFGKESLADYKQRVIRGIIDSNPDDQFILIGDDTQADFEVYDSIFRYAPSRVLAIYIRKVTNRKLPPSAYAFLTAYDIARFEFLFDRLEVEDAAPVALAILGEQRDSRIVPRFNYCPLSPSFVSDPRIEGWYRDIDARIQKICESRSLSYE